MQYSICSLCHAVLVRESANCPSCNTLLTPEKIERVRLCEQDGTPVPVGGHFCSTCGSQMRDRYIPRGTWWWVVVLLSIAITILLGQLHQYIYTTFQQETCKITYEGVETYRSKSSTTYQPGFSYDVMDNRGSLVATGDSSMGLGSFSSFDDAQQAMDQYQLDATYSCWYSPIASPSAMLVQPNMWGSMFFPLLLWLLGGGALLIALGWCVVHMFVYPRGLYKRTITTYGLVIKHEVQRTKKKVSITSIVEFQTQTEPSLRCLAKKRGEEPLHAKVVLCYDWLHPAENAEVIAVYTKSAVIIDMIIGLFLVLLIVGGGSAFFIRLAFQF